MHVDEPRFVRGKIAVWQPTESLAARDRAPGTPVDARGRAQLAWIDAACDLVLRGGADALVTGPVSKDAIVRSGAPGTAASSSGTPSTSSGGSTRARS